MTTRKNNISINISSNGHSRNVDSRLGLMEVEELRVGFRLPEFGAILWDKVCKLSIPITLPSTDQ